MIKIRIKRKRNVGGNRQGRWKTYRNILMTFAASGLWHGASRNYVAWGLINGFYQVIGDLTQGGRRKVRKLLHIREDRWSYHFFHGLVTFLLIDLSWLFFRAASLRTAFQMLLHSARVFGPLSMLDASASLGINTLGLGEKDFYLLLSAIVFLIFMDIARKRWDIRRWLLEQNILFLFLFSFLAIFSIVIFGVYGPGFDATTFIYFQF